MVPMWSGGHFGHDYDRALFHKKEIFDGFFVASLSPRSSRWIIPLSLSLGTRKGRILPAPLAALLEQ